MDTVSVLTVTKLLHDACVEDSEQTGMVSRVIRKLQFWVGEEHVSSFLSQCCSYLFIDKRYHATTFDFFKMFLRRSRQKSAKQSPLPHIIIHMFGALPDDTEESVGGDGDGGGGDDDKEKKKKKKKQLKNQETTHHCTVVLQELLFQMVAYLEKWKTHQITSWRQLPVSLYRAMECWLRPEKWEGMNLQRYSLPPSCPPSLYHLMDPTYYLEVKQTPNWTIPRRKHGSKGELPFPTSSEQHVQTATLAALTLLQQQLKQPPKVRRTYSLLCHHLLSDDNIEEEWLRELVREIRQPTPDSEYNKLCVTLKELPAGIAIHQRNHSFSYYLRSMKLVQPQDTPIQSLPLELSVYRRLHARTRGKLRVLRFSALDCSTLSLQLTMRQLSVSYPAASLSDDYVIYRSERFVYLALSKLDYKLITGCLLPHLRINGYFPNGALPVFLHVAEGLLQGTRKRIHTSLQSVYDLTVGWASRQSYFKTVQDRELMCCSVRLLAAYAGFFESPAELLEALTRPYADSSVRELRGSDQVHLFRDTHCPQEVIKALILLDKVHHMRRSDYDTLVHYVCKEKRGQGSWSEYDRIAGWLRGTHNKGHTSEIISLRRKPFDFLYSYLLESGEFTQAESRELVEGIRVRSNALAPFRTLVPGQTPGLGTALRLYREPQLERRYEAKLGKLVERRTNRSLLSRAEVDQLCMMLRVLEYVRMCSPKLGSPVWRGDALRPPAYLSELAYSELFGEYKSAGGLPVQVTLEGELQQHLFPIFSTHYVASYVPQHVLHTTDLDFLNAALHCPLPQKAVGPFACHNNNSNSNSNNNNNKRKRLQTLTQRKKRRRVPSSLE